MSEWMKMKLLLTGPPQVGKTTIIKRFCKQARAEGIPIKGFYTEEIREGGKRVGFKLVTLDGQEVVFSHVRFYSPFKVGKYKVDIKALEAVLPSILPSHAELIVIDEIGKMECFSERFKQTVWKILHAPNPFLGTIALKGRGFIEKVKQLKQVEIIEVNLENRDSLPEFLLRKLQFNE